MATSEWICSFLCHFNLSVASREDPLEIEEKRSAGFSHHDNQFSNIFRLGQELHSSSKICKRHKRRHVWIDI